MFVMIFIVVNVIVFEDDIHFLLVFDFV